MRFVLDINAQVVRTATGVRGTAHRPRGGPWQQLCTLSRLRPFSNTPSKGRITLSVPSYKQVRGAVQAQMARGDSAGAGDQAQGFGSGSLHAKARWERGGEGKEARGYCWNGRALCPDLLPRAGWGLGSRVRVWASHPSQRVPCTSVSSLGGSGRGCISIDGRWGAVLTAQGSGRGRGRGGGVERIRLGEQG